ncbi:hypothetical protein [Bradyrhizobium iriomotense]|uniref:Uncharacterized protein n=1 Tax=Bradyrhizobium iriomotense TaxID=441950 RepID=A0ABQ6B1S3_9BRAD|nr:hypothetical protein [Bradyrhizobium iriomotense]GLR87349.1 hypothetical protein GCM10007857_40600 [Bradyrhizobium iriomotense]
MKHAIVALQILTALISPARAENFTREQKSTIDLVARIIVAGTDDNCRHLVTIDRAIAEELLNAGVTPDQQMDTMEVALSVSRADARSSYDSNPSRFCKEAWQFAGKNGAYKRQMLEIK